MATVSACGISDQDATSDSRGPDAMSRDAAGESIPDVPHDATAEGDGSGSDPIDGTLPLTPCTRRFPIEAEPTRDPRKCTTRIVTTIPTVMPMPDLTFGSARLQIRNGFVHWAAGEFVSFPSANRLASGLHRVALAGGTVEVVATPVQLGTANGGAIGDYLFIGDLFFWSGGSKRFRMGGPPEGRSESTGVRAASVEGDASTLYFLVIDGTPLTDTIYASRVDLEGNLRDLTRVASRSTPRDALTAWRALRSDGCPYWSDGNTVLTLPEGSQTPVELVRLGAIQHLAIDASNVYIGRGAPQFGSRLVKVPRGGGGATTLHATDRLIRNVAVDATHVYVVEESQLVAMCLADGSMTELATLAKPSLVATDADAVYYFTAAGELMRFGPP